ncbi:MAG: TetR/AcrR family transcriptional regulator [Stackebrandtia sp.]
MAESPSAQRGRQVRQKLLASAVELIGEVGWTAVSTRLLAERAQVRSGLVHYHFASLQALLREAAMGMIERTLSGTTNLTADDPGELVDSMLHSLDAFSGRDPASLVMIETFLAATRDVELRRELSAVLARLRGDLAARFAAAGVANPEGSAVTVLAALDGFVLQKALHSELDAALVSPALRRVTASTTKEGEQE